MTGAIEELQEEQDSISEWVSWMRGVAPYVHALKNKVIVIAMAGEMIAQGQLERFISDVSMLSAIGARIVLCYGVRPQVQELMELKKIESTFVGGLRVTDPAALSCVKEAAGEVRLDIEAAFSMGLPNTPMAHSNCRVVSGNFVTARPMGIINGVDFRHTGVVRKVDVEGIRAQLDNRNIVVVSPLGFSPTGEAFNIAMEEVAATIAGALKAEKFILLSNVDGVRRFDEVVTELTTDQAKDLMDKRLVDDEDIYNLRYAIQALKKGCRRVHILPYFVDGAILAELFTHDGIGTMVTEENMDSIRDATAEDINGLIQLLEPLEEDGTLVKRPREKLEREIDRYTLLEHDGIIYGSAALYPFPAEKIGEMGALVVNSTYQGSGDGERLLHHIENKARRMGLNRLFVLTTRTAHWFLKRGFKPATIDDLPVAKRELYNWQRRSQIFIKDL
jgi:amino-acid N-acetyltransferase